MFSECNCNDEGSSSFICDVATGQCPCKSDLITGEQCDHSTPGFFNFPDPERKLNWQIIEISKIIMFFKNIFQHVHVM